MRACAGCAAPRSAASAAARLTPAAITGPARRGDTTTCTITSGCAASATHATTRTAGGGRRAPTRRPYTYHHGGRDHEGEGEPDRGGARGRRRGAGRGAGEAGPGVQAGAEGQSTAPGLRAERRPGGRGQGRRGRAVRGAARGHPGLPRPAEGGGPVSVVSRPWTYVSLFSGVGGLDLGVKLACPAARCLLYVEGEIFACEVLAKCIEEGRLDDAPIWTDVRSIDYGPWRHQAGGVVAGFPCPPVSVAGRRKGTGDERWLWPQVWRAYRETGARWLFVENVPGLLTANDGDAFNAILTDLAQGGLSAEWLHLQAADVGASHKRDRFWLLAHRADEGRGLRGSTRVPPRRPAGTLECRGGGDVAHREGGRPEGIAGGGGGQGLCRGGHEAAQEPQWQDEGRSGQDVRHVALDGGGGDVADRHGGERDGRANRGVSGAQPYGHDLGRRGGDVADARCERRQQDARGASGHEAADGRARRHGREPDGDHQSERLHPKLADAECDGHEGRQPAGGAEAAVRRRPAERGREAMEHTEGDGRGQGRAEHGVRGGRHAAADCVGSGVGGVGPDADGPVADALRGGGDGPHVGLEPGHVAADALGAGQGPAAGAASGAARPLFAPGPARREWWAAVLQDAPWLAPALSEEEAQCLLRGVAPGTAAQLDFAHRVDRLRALGNLAQPLCSATSFSLLHKRLTGLWPWES